MIRGVTNWAQLQTQWTWPEAAWILAHGGRAQLERVISYERDCLDMFDHPTPPLVAWAVKGWLKEHEKPKPTRIEL